MNSDVEQIISELRLGLQAEYGDRLVKLIVFGSAARGEAHLDSDIDVLVVLKGPIRPGVEIARVGKLKTELCLRHGRVVSCVFMELERFLHRNGPLLRNIRREGVAV